MNNKTVIVLFSLITNLSYPYVFTRETAKSTRELLIKKEQQPTTSQSTALSFIPQPIQNRPVKSTVSGGAVLYGIKLLFEGNKTRSIQPDNQFRAYDKIGFGTEIVGGILTIIGAYVLYKVFSEPEEANQKK